MKYKIQRGFVSPIVDLQHPNAPMTTAYEVYSKKLLGPWTHIKTFDTRFDAEYWLYDQGVRNFKYKYAERWLK